MESPALQPVAAMSFQPWRQFFQAALFLLVCSAWCAAQSYKSLCIEGSDKFHTTSHTHVEVTVEPAESAGFGAHVCRADLKWDKQSLVVADKAAEIDLDLFDVDLEGLGPVAAFEVKESAEQCCTEYRIFALEKQVRLLRALHGGSFFAADTDMDDRVEIWAQDLAAIDGLDGLTQGDIEYPPTYVLRFEQGRLLDASAAFQDHFDQIIAGIRKTISADDLDAFEKSDGILRFSIKQLDLVRKLRVTKIQVLEIVWAYLYSGREAAAWKTLHAMWPTADEERIQALLIKARSGGILTQIDGVSNPAPTKLHSQIFEDDNKEPATVIMRMGTQMEAKPARVYAKGEVTQAEPIHMWRPLPTNPNSSILVDEETIELVIDSAGKVRSARWTDDKKPRDEELLAYARVWKFIPAHKHDRSVASRLRFAVFAKR